MVDEDVVALPDAVQAAHPLLEPDKAPRDVPVDHHVRGLQVDALAARVGGDQDLELACQEVLLHPVPVAVLDRALKRLGRVPGRSEQAGEPAGSVGELGKHQQLPGAWLNVVPFQQPEQLGPLRRVPAGLRWPAGLCQASGR